MPTLVSVGFTSALVATFVLPTSFEVFDAAAQEQSDGSELARQAEPREQVAANDAIQGDEDEADAVTSLNARRREAIERGIAFLKGQQEEPGNWPDYKLFRGGMTALCTLALLEAGVPPTDEAVTKALAWLRENDRPEFIYVVSLVTRAYARAGFPEDRGRIKRNADWLGSTMISRGKYEGAWSYQEGQSGWDNSNSSYAILGLEAAEAAGVEVPGGVWRAALAYWLRAQNDDGSWGYQPGIGGTGSMTASGMASVEISWVQLADPTPDEARAASTALDRAYAWTSKNYSVAGNPHPNGRGVVSRWHYYYLAALTGALRSTQQSRLGDHDWRKDTTELLLKQQREDGSWSGDEFESNSTLATAFALVALANVNPPQDRLGSRSRVEQFAEKRLLQSIVTTHDGAPVAEAFVISPLRSADFDAALITDSVSDGSSGADKRDGSKIEPRRVVSPLGLDIWRFRVCIIEQEGNRVGAETRLAQRETMRRRQDGCGCGRTV